MSESGNGLTWIVVVAVIAVLAVSALLFLNEVEPDEGAIDDVEEDAETSVTTSETETATPPPEEKPSDLATETVSEGQRETIAPEGIFFSGQVLEQDSDLPIRNFQVRLILDESELKRRSSVEVINEKVQDEVGRFAFPLEEGGRHTLYVTAPNYREKRFYPVEIPADTGLTDFEIRLENPLVIYGRVVNDATGKPVEGAIIGALVSPLNMHRKRGTFGFSDGDNTDLDGRFSLIVGLKRNYKVVALHPDFVEGFCETSPGPEEVEIRVKQTGLYIYGSVTNDDGTPAKGVEIMLSGKQLLRKRTVHSKDDGAYISPHLLSGKIEIRASQPQVDDDERQLFTTEIKRVNLEDNPLKVDFGPIAEHTTWRGLLIDVVGTPVVDGTVNVRSEVAIEREDKPLIERSVKSDNKGRFEVPKLSQGQYRIHVRVPGKQTGFGIDCGEIIFHEPGLHEKDILMSGGEVNGVIIDGETGQPLSHEIGTIRAFPKLVPGKHYRARINKDGRFCLTNLPSDTYFLDVRLDYGRFDYSGRIEKLKIVNGQVLNDVKIIVNQDGVLRFKISGVEEIEEEKFIVRMRHLDSDTRLGLTDYSPPVETWSGRVRLQPGNWILEIERSDLGFAECPFALEPGEESKVTIRAQDFRKK